jgi:hypothetical protein
MYLCVFDELQCHDHMLKLGYIGPDRCDLLVYIGPDGCDLLATYWRPHAQWLWQALVHQRAVDYIPGIIHPVFMFGS